MKQKNLIFLISQPRSGSTLLQKVLGNHSKIYTRSEPWIMLPFSQFFRKKGFWTNYDSELSTLAIDNFICNLPDGKKDFVKELRKFILKLYSKYLQISHKKYFLDKTPRYYSIENELFTIFPKAKYILLIRNPLSILSSILNTWVKNDYNKLKFYKYDLFYAIDQIIALKENQNIYTIYYENFTQSSEKEISQLLNFINLEYEMNILNYNKLEKMFFGDQNNIYKFDGIQKGNDTSWIKSLSNPDYYNFLYEYLMFIGKEKFSKLGYDFEENLRIIEKNKPSYFTKKSIFNYIEDIDYFKRDMYFYLNNSYKFNI